MEKRPFVIPLMRPRPVEDPTCQLSGPAGDQVLAPQYLSSAASPALKQGAASRGGTRNLRPDRAGRRRCLSWGEKELCPVGIPQAYRGHQGLQVPWWCPQELHSKLCVSLASRTNIQSHLCACRGGAGMDTGRPCPHLLLGLSARVLRPPVPSDGHLPSPTCSLCSSSVQV